MRYTDDQVQKKQQDKTCIWHRDSSLTACRVQQLGRAGGHTKRGGAGGTDRCYIGLRRPDPG